MSIKISKKKNKLVIIKDEETIFPYAYMTYNDFNRDYANFIKANYSLFSISIMTGEHGVNEFSEIPALSKGLYINQDKIDYSSLDEQVGHIISLNPKAYIIVRINLNAPDWWRKLNKRELIKLSDGTTYMESPTSKKYFTFITNYLTEVYKHILSSSYKDNVIALHLGGLQTEEWISMRTGTGSYDYSSSFKTYYHSFLKKKYRDITSLNQNYHTDYSYFKDIDLPNLEEYASKRDLIPFDYLAKQKEIDYLEAFNDATASLIIKLVKFSKKLVNDTMLIGVFYGYIGQLHAVYGHSSLSKILSLKELDFLAFPPAYVNSRQGAYDFFYHTAIDSIKKRNKLVFIENDQRTFLSQYIYELRKDLTFKDKTKEMLSVPTWKGPNSLEESLSVLTRGFAKSLISNEGYWWFDMWGGFYRHPKIMNFMKKSLAIIKKSKVTNNNEIALILDDHASFETNEYLFHQLSYAFFTELGFIGTSYDIYSVKDVDKIKNQYKCLIYMLPSYLTRKKYNLNSGVGNYLIGKENHYINQNITYLDLITYLTNNDVHLYSKGNIVYQSKEYISITARSSGTTYLNFKNEVIITNVFNKKEAYQGKEISLTLVSNESKLFKIKQK